MGDKHQQFSLLSPACWVLPLVCAGFFVLLKASGSNEALFISLNGVARVLSDTFWANTTFLGDGLVICVLVLAFAGRRVDVVWSLFICAIISSLAVHLLKDYYGVLRPPALLDPGLYHLIGPVLRQGSFPSGHTTAAFSFFGVLFLLFNRRSFRAGFLGLAILIGFSRVAVGVHWPLDVLAGAALGWCSAVLAVVLAQYFKTLGELRQIQWPIVILLIGGAVSLLFHNSGLPGTELLQWTIGLGSLGLGVSGIMKHDSPRLRRGL